MLGLNLEWINKRFRLLLLPLNDTIGNIFFLMIIASNFDITFYKIRLNMLSGILFLKGFEDLCGLPFQNLDFIIY